MFTHMHIIYNYSRKKGQARHRVQITRISQPLCQFTESKIKATCQSKREAAAAAVGWG